MLQITNAGGQGALPATVSGTGTTTKLFAPQLNVPGSGRLDGAAMTVRASGNITPGVGETVLLSIVASYPTLTNGSPQYPFSNITNASGNTTGGANIALYNANNNFVIGQFVNVTNVSASLNGLVGPLIVANSTAFAGQVAGANVGNAAAITLTNSAGATIQPIFLYNGGAATVLNSTGTTGVGSVLPFFAEVQLMGDAGSGIIACWGHDTVINVNIGNQGGGIMQTLSSALGNTAGVANVSSVSGAFITQPVPGVNFKNEPALILQVGETFGTSNAGNAATLKSFYLES